ncbi:hypothetical protein L5515_016260 [Caenorhabditis briggsae]|uniref:Uncharacterized protein n=1 Tax=Caenorhabditis briggsae TaxID=6238 RepID=A0AAE9JP34_CAEBR|nr:hypothetical protein L5515_016260 [Caenorhabditis briggsae]
MEQYKEKLDVLNVLKFIETSEACGCDGPMPRKILKREEEKTSQEAWTTYQCLSQKCSTSTRTFWKPKRVNWIPCSSRDLMNKMAVKNNDFNS